MEAKTLVIAAVIIAATAGIAVAPLASSAMALRNGDSVNRCVHNGNGDDRCGPGNSSTDVTCTKVRGKFVCSSN